MAWARGAVRGSIILALAMALSTAAGAQESAAPVLRPAAPQVAATQGSLHLQVSEGRLIELPRAAATVFVADPAIADVQAPTRTSVFVFGKSPGRTSVFALDATGHPIIARDVVVAHDIADLEQLIKQQVPGAAVVASSTPAGIVLRGSVPSPDAAEAVQTLAARFAGEKGAVINRLALPAATEVNLRVRVAEVDRQITKQFGFNWNAIANPGAFSFGLFTGRTFLSSGAGALSSANQIVPAPVLATGASIPGSILAGVQTSRVSADTLLDLLAEQGLVTILAEPNLTAISGQPASFLAGGEFPIPVAQINNTTTIEFKKFGVSLEFVPTVLTDNRITIKVKPEVSQLSSEGAIQLQGITIPALSVRRAETSVELGSGQSFAIAGLIQNNSSTDITKYPGLGDVPVLGTLFRSSSFQRNEFELVIIVTPYIVHPVASAEAMRLPTDGFAPATDLERIFQGAAAKAAPAASPHSPGIGLGGERLLGDAGFTLE